MPAELRTYRLKKLNFSLDEIDNASALRLDALLRIDDAVKEAEARAGRVDSQRDRAGPP
ncbi:MAG TPA: hypothetical protein VFB19_18590 [Mycobacterium sp.]|nr:hypothetical protein [Mycobacterium sp.]